LPDSQLVALCRSGDHDAWGELVHRFSGFVYAIARGRFGLERDDAEDVFQEVFARTYEHLGTLRSDGAIRAWISQVTYCSTIDLLRRSSRERAADQPVDSQVPDEAVADCEEALWLEQMLDGLPPPSREIMDRFFVRDQSYARISADLGVPPGTVASRISRGLAKLRAEAHPVAGGL
jgi:RNA polymerase sigma-70 factor (ECF subfamily)